MEFAQDKDFMLSVMELNQKGGKFSSAAQQVLNVIRVSQRKREIKDVFVGLVTTNYGESRLQHCVKYDLRGSCRLITVQHNDICLLLYTGTHDDCDEWLESNKGKRFHIKNIQAQRVIEATRVTEDILNPDTRLTMISDLTPGPLWGRLPERYFDALCVDAPADYVVELKKLTSIVADDELLELALQAPEGYSEVIYDTFELLKAGQVQEAKGRIDQFKGTVVPLEKAAAKDIKTAVSGDEVVFMGDVDPVLFEHFVKTASFEKWMLYLHPGQRELAHKDFNGPAKLTGVSGSGKTAVLIHRAVRLARLYPEERVLVLTLNRALSKLIKDLVSSALGDDAPSNLEVKSFWELCKEKLASVEPENQLIYSDKTVATNRFAVSEHIDDIWAEYYERRNNNADATILWPLHRTLLARKIFPADYVRQEFDYLRSALAPSERQQYLALEREGRAVPLEERYRQAVITGLSAWEKKMSVVGAVDYLGLTTALYKHIDQLRPEYRSILVDEMQDFGTVELKIIRRLAARQQNDIFLCGDTAQSVLTKYHKLSEADIEVSGRSHSILKNYRNSREILSAASQLFQRNRTVFAGAPNIEILNPEFANFSSPPPLLLEGTSLPKELGHALGHLRNRIDEQGAARTKACIAICGLSQVELENLAAQIGLDVLTGDTNVVAGKVFLSDLEQTKGFEFDSMVILNCSETVIPHPLLPPEESYRELCKLYVAMTRGKTELIVSYTGSPSPFIQQVADSFTSGIWADYSEPEKLNVRNFRSTRFAAEPVSRSEVFDAETVLMLPEAAGLSNPAQEKLLQLVPGTNRFRTHKQIAWKRFDDCIETLKKSPALMSLNSVSENTWTELDSLYSKISLRKSEPMKWSSRETLTLKSRAST
ncbi:UvrD-helicase domain-containing protein [Burkholderia pseudomallei]|uniref:UvrD-helicase domain-containing protein n=1 Tax=Burkholderia pseudomallei TaxID=28450 RepID=UPI0021F6D1C6|nr:UvrD-helicase domain-containing protein [Burkholderia pseudomallei]MCW0048883.1 UvrD-helicase domain-containing protein [Burkholderia pseudomallei]